MSDTFPSPDEELAALETAQDLAARGESDRAIDTLTALAARQSLNPEIYLELGRLYRLIGQDDLALTYLRQSAELEFGGNQALLQLLEMHIDAGDIGLAFGVLARMLKQGCNREDVLGVVGGLLEQISGPIDSLNWLAPGASSDEAGTATNTANQTSPPVEVGAKRHHPYRQQPDHAFWNRSVAQQAWEDINLLVAPKFSIGAEEPIAAAGSCFARHISRQLRQSGYRFLETEPAHPILTPEEAATYGYGSFSARYGNIYTARQLLELLEQALGHRAIIEDFHETRGRFFDLLRPTIQPEGFSTWQEARHDRIHHLRCVARMLAEASVFVFTLGLTEAWVNGKHGHTYPVCPGTAAGTYDPACHRFHNFGFNEVLADMRAARQLMRNINPGLKIILTVSPVPLMATMEQQHVLVASSASKAILRSVCAELECDDPLLQYFPSFEIVSAAASQGRYFEPDHRTIRPEGVAHVMRSFQSAYFSTPPTQAAATETDTYAALANQLQSAECDEMFNNPGQEMRGNG
jgi:tetratricopeptide (TPR) repeat protein